MGRASEANRSRQGVATILLFAVSVALLQAVVPRVATDPFPGATAGHALPALRTIAGLDLALAALLVWRLRRPPSYPRLWIIVLGVLVAWLLLQAVALTDAAVAYAGHGSQAVLLASYWLFGCVLASVLAAVLIALSALQRR